MYKVSHLQCNSEKMKLKLHILFILLLGLSTGEIQAQVSLAFSDDVFYQDTVLLNSTQEFSLELMNTGEDTLLEPVEIFMSRRLLSRWECLFLRILFSFQEECWKSLL